MLVMFDDKLHTIAKGEFLSNKIILNQIFLDIYNYVLGDISKLWFIACAVQLTCIHQLAVILL